MRLSILMLFAMILGPELPALTKVSKAQLPLFFEVANAQSADFQAAHTTPCNYMYIAFDDTLLYYGTAKDCRDRMRSHNSPITSANEVVVAYDAAILATTPGAANGVQRAVRDAATRTNPAPMFNSDPCLGIMLANGRVTIWERRFNSADEAGEFEACVLGQRSQFAKDANGFPVNGIKGNCNRTVSGSADASPGLVNSTLGACQSWLDKWLAKRAKDTDIKTN